MDGRDNNCREKDVKDIDEVPCKCYKYFCGYYQSKTGAPADTKLFTRLLWL
jgi:hypothetical protein